MRFIQLKIGESFRSSKFNTPVSIDTTIYTKIELSKHKPSCNSHYILPRDLDQVPWLCLTRFEETDQVELVSNVSHLMKGIPNGNVF